MGSSGMVFARRQHQRAAFRKRMKTRSRYVNFVLYGIVELKAFFFMFKARRYRYVHEKVVVRCSGCRFSCDVPARHVKGCFPPREDEKQPGVVAVVNGSKISLNDFNREVYRESA